MRSTTAACGKLLISAATLVAAIGCDLTTTPNNNSDRESACSNGLEETSAATFQATGFLINGLAVLVGFDPDAEDLEEPAACMDSSATTGRWQLTVGGVSGGWAQLWVAEAGEFNLIDDAATVSLDVHLDAAAMNADHDMDFGAGSWTGGSVSLIQDSGAIDMGAQNVTGQSSFGDVLALSFTATAEL